MGYKVFYFSRSGNSKRIAQKIGDSLKVQVYQIEDGIDWSGFKGYLKAIYYSIANKDIKVNVNTNFNKEDEIFLVGPLWVGGLAPTIKSFLKKYPYKTINLVISSKASKIHLKNKDQFKSVTEIVEKDKNEDEVIKTLINSL
ncbi:flavodoxin family protein [Thermobrachium celere]|uniref:Pyruvate carboxyltransferase n=1 Tax=Thermobrachium celere DSM 8682 TaxID=941824 RepID=R7RT55_9CLOT|nr:pyruvate carboxyltransferase [Thermobrachium celere]CDF59392.1 pyruvate carboxyltransferase [Thermobrachium celere DSM 8682]